MAVKPLTQPLYWATDAVYSTGPFVGQPQKVTPPLGFAAEGHRPGANFPTPAEYENSQQYNLTGLARWVFAGSSTGAADAHVVETDAAGMTTLHRLTVNDLVNEVAMLLTGVGVLVPAMLVTNTSGGGGIVSQIGNTNGAAYGASLGSGSGFGLYSVMTATVAGGAGMRCDADAATAASGLVLNHAGSGLGAELNHSGTGPALQITHTGNVASAAVITAGVNARALLATGSGTGQGAVVQAGTSATSAALVAQALTSSALGVDSTGGSASAAGTGVRGTGAHADAHGVHGRTSTSASTIAAAVVGEGRGAGTTGVLALNSVGRAAVFQGDATSPAYAATRWLPQDADPTAGSMDGEVFWHANHKTLRTAVAGAGWRSMMGMGPGSAMFVQASMPVPNLLVPASVVTVTVVPTTLLTLNWDTGDGTGFYGSANNAKVFVKFDAEVRLTIGPTPDTLNVRVTDTTNGVIALEMSTAGTDVTDGIYIPSATMNWQRVGGFGFLYQPPTDGDLTLEIIVWRVSNNLQLRCANAIGVGTFR